MLQERLARDLNDAMRAKDRVRMSAIRMIQTAITEREKAGTGPVSDDDLLQIVTKQAKQRRDSMAQYAEAGRDDLAQREADELTIIETYLPAQLTDEDIHRAVHEIVQRTGATTMKDMGRVMGEAMSELRGQADGARVQLAVSEDGGATSGERVRFDAERPIGRVGVALLPNGSAVVSWLEAVGESAELRLRRVAADGTRGEPVTVATVDAGRSSGVPHVVALGEQALVAWTDPATATVRTAVVDV